MVTAESSKKKSINGLNFISMHPAGGVSGAPVYKALKIIGEDLSLIIMLHYIGLERNPSSFLMAIEHELR